METIKQKVYEVYNNYQDAVNFDVVLLAIYENYFGKLTHNAISSVKRAGRYWRSRNFKRSLEVLERDKKTQNEVFGAFV
jgi:hypothetical protein